MDLKEVLEEHRQRNEQRGGKRLDQDYKKLWDMKTEVTRAKEVIERGPQFVESEVQ